MIFLAVSLSIIASLSTCWLYSILWRRRVRREAEIESIIGGLRTEIGRMLTELNGTAERNVALLENRIHSASGMADRLERSALVIQKELGKREHSDRVYTSLGQSRPMNIVLEPEPPPRPPEPVDFESLSTREKALVLHRNGEEPESIGAKLDMSRGEVELIISLHDRRH